MKISFVDTNRHWTIEEFDKVEASLERDLMLWRQDYEYVGVMIKAPDESRVKVSYSKNDYASIDTFTLESTLAFVGHAGWYAQNREGVMPTGPKVSVDDVVKASNSFDIDEKGYKMLLLKVSSHDVCHDVDLDIVVTVDDVDTHLKIKLKIVDLVMPTYNNYTFNVEYWHHPYNVAEYYNVEPWSAEHLEILRKHQILYRELGGKGVICTLLDEVWGGQTYSKHDIRYPSMIKWIKSKGKWTFDYTDFDKWVDLNREIGLDDKFICYSMMPWNSQMRYYNADKEKYINRHVPLAFAFRYKKAWRVFLNDFIEHLDEKGIFDSVYIGFDERNNMSMILDFLQSFTNKNGHHFKVSASFNNYMGNKKCLDRIDSASVGMGEIKAHESEFESIVSERNSQGKFTSLYTACEDFPNSFALSVPAESYYSIIYAYSLGNNGFLRWAYDAWVANPLVDTTHWSFQAGDCFMIYPGYTDTTPQLSYRLVKLNEAVRDVNKLAILSQNSKLTGIISKILEKTRKNYSYNEAYNSSWAKAGKKAKWIDEKSKVELINDVNSIKDAINDVTKLYFDKK